MRSAVNKSNDTSANPAVLTTVEEARQWTHERQRRGERVALVPTMGALHEGHLALVRRAQSLADAVAVSIFVNPTQFGPQEDFQRYPRAFAEDLEHLRVQQTAMVFAPAADEMYGQRFSTSIAAPAVSRPLEGQFRPGHFDGVCTVVTKLFQIVPADVAVFGQKDYQQARVIQDLVRDLNLAIEIDVLPTVREHDGLALSSRNRYLSPDERQRAVGISQTLAQVDQAYQNGECNTEVLQQIMLRSLQQIPVDSIDYAAVVDPETLLPLDRPLPTYRDPACDSRASLTPRVMIGGASHATDSSGTPRVVAVALIAARMGATRLIDNRSLMTCG